MDPALLGAGFICSRSMWNLIHRAALTVDVRIPAIQRVDLSCAALTRSGMSATDRLLLGALAGIAATCAMTAAARAMHRRLPAAERYSLPPREIVEGGLPATTKRSLAEHGRQTATIAAHFGYGAVTGALYALAAPKGSILSGAAYGVLVWAVSYFGIMPGLRILQPAHDHPARRNALMIAAHLVWGSTLARTLRDLEFAEREIFAGDVAPDATAFGPVDEARARLATLADAPGDD